VAAVRFGTDGWRGVIGETFTFENLRRVAQATCVYVKEQGWPLEKGAFVGYDARFLSEEFARAVAEVFAANGIKVKLSSSMVPTPFVTFMIARGDAGFGVSITASHNPYQYNGYKLRTPKGGAAPPEITKPIEGLVGEVQVNTVPLDEAISKGLVEVVNPYPSYFRWVSERVDLERIGRAGFKVVVDPMHGSASGLLQGFLFPAGCSVYPVNHNRDAFFSFKHPEPIEKNLGELIAKVREVGAHIGVATDGDGDRVGLVDERGRFITPHQIYALILLHLVKNRNLKGDIAKTVSTTSLLNRIAEKYGFSVRETAVGFKYIADMLADGEVVMGGEESGGIGVRFHIPERDGTFSALLVLEYMASEGRTLGELVDQLHEEFGPHLYRRMDIKVRDVADARRFVEGLEEAPPDSIASLRVASTNFVDGAKFILEDGSWILFRPSGTEPLLRVYCESSSEDRLREILSYGSRLVEERLS